MEELEDFYKGVEDLRNCGYFNSTKGRADNTAVNYSYPNITDIIDRATTSMRDDFIVSGLPEGTTPEFVQEILSSFFRSNDIIVR